MESRGPSWLAGRWLAIVAAMWLVLASGCERQPSTMAPSEQLANQIPGRDLRKNPPEFDAMFFKKGSGGRITIVAKAATGEHLPATITAQADAERITLRDDGRSGDETAGDGLFTATVRMDARDLEFEEKASSLFVKQPFRTGFSGRRFHGIPPETYIKLWEPLRVKGFIPIPPVFPPTPPPIPVTIDRSLMITDLGVVNDPARTFDPCTAPCPGALGKWTFGYLMTEMANEPLTGVNASDFTLRWLNRWMFNQTINDWNVPARTQILNTVINNWPKLPDGRLDLRCAPFRLLAIVNRVDLRENLLYGTGSAGEARFVFGVIGPGCSTLPFTVIFEYGIKKNGCMALRDWARQWANLSTMTPGTPAYNAALEAITEQFAKRDSDPSKPNGSALNQLRTNEIALAGPWELREFRIFDTDSDAHQLREVTVKQTPDLSLNNSGTLDNFMAANAALIPSKKHVVPLEFPMGSHFLGGAAPTPGGLFWDAPAHHADYPVRSNFSVSTCNGCHAGETSTGFTHVSPRPPGSPAALSGFLTGITVNDPAGTTNSTHFQDLEDRRLDLEGLTGRPCFFEFFHRPLLMTH